MHVFHFVLMILSIPILALVILGVIILGGAKVWRGETPRMSKDQRDEETKLIQELHHGLAKMEARIEALETIMLDPERRGKDEKN